MALISLSDAPIISQKPVTIRVRRAEPHHDPTSNHRSSMPSLPGEPRKGSRYTGESRRTVLKPRAPFIAAASGPCADRRFHGSALSHTLLPWFLAAASASGPAITDFATRRLNIAFPHLPAHSGQTYRQSTGLPVGLALAPIGAFAVQCFSYFFIGLSTLRCGICA